MTLSRHACAAVAAVALAAAACGTETPEEIETETVVAVRTAPATVGAIRGTVHATGIVAPAPGAELVVVAPAPARIAAIPAGAGDRVRRGDVLVRFDIPDAFAEVKRQQAEVERAGAALETARAAQKRTGELFERGVAARREVEDATRAAADADATLAQARASLAAAQASAGRAIVRASFDGIVAARQHNPGDLVEPSAGDPVMRVIDPRRLEVVASVPLAEASRTKVGAAARVTATAESGDTELALKVVSTPAAVEPGTATVPVRLAPAAPANVPAGTPVQVDIDAEEHTGVVLVPAVAIVREGEQTAVFVASGGKAHRRAVRIGLADGTSAEVVSGVKAGEAVIVDGQAGLPDGAAISTAAPEETGR